MPFISSLRVVPLLRAWSVRANGLLGSYVAPLLNAVDEEIRSLLKPTGNFRETR